MHTITLKASDEFYEKLNRLANRVEKTKSALIREAVLAYERQLEKEEIKKQMKKASFKVRGHLEEINLWEDTVDDGL